MRSLRLSVTGKDSNPRPPPRTPYRDRTGDLLGENQASVPLDRRSIVRAGAAGSERATRIPFVLGPDSWAPARVFHAPALPWHDS